MNFRSQRGATGSDIIVSVTLIILAVSIVSMIYVNTTLQSRNVTRTAGATRIATNILENIEKMTYEEFVNEYNSSTVGWVLIDEDNEYKGYKSINKTLSSSPTVFGTKIPNGYTLYLSAEPNYGSYANSEEAEKLKNQFDLVREIKLAITYNVGDVTEKIEFSTSKTREYINDVNMPDTKILYSQNIINTEDGKKFYPIKYSEIAKGYIKTTEDDLEWYDYSEKKWAMVLISSEEENTLFDLNGKVIVDTSDTSICLKYVWIPRFFYSTDEKFSEFAYLTTDKAIGENEIIANDNSTILKYNTFIEKSDTSNTATDMNGNNGMWILATNLDKINENHYGEILNNSKYGPCSLH